MQRQRLVEAQLDAMYTLYAVGAAFGSIKMSEFNKLMEKTRFEKKETNVDIDYLKQKGIPVEDK